MVDSMSATSSFLRRPAADTTHGVDRGHGDGAGIAVERDVAGDLGRQPVGCADGGILRLQNRDGGPDGAVIQRRMGGAGDQDKDILHAVWRLPSVIPTKRRR